MRLNDLLTVSVRQVVRHRRRYLGVVLAIALGVAGFITIITMSREVKKNFNEDLDLIGGVTIIRIYFDNSRSYRPQWFRDNTLARLEPPAGRQGNEPHRGQEEATPTGTGRNTALPWLAVDETFWQVRNFWAQTGNLFGAEAVAGHKRECVLGAELARKIFGSHDVRGQIPGNQ